MNAILSGNRGVFLVGLLALAVRLAFVWSQGAPARLSNDAVEYDAYAVHLVSAGEFAGSLPAGERASRMPGYPLFLAIVYFLCGHSFLAVQWAQCVLGALTCLLLYVLAQSLLEKPWPLLCAIACALNWDLIQSCSSILSECFYAFLITAAFAALHRGSWSPWTRAVGAGAGLGCAYLVRPEILPWALLLFVALPWLLRSFPRKAASLGLLVVALCAAVWTTRNFAIFHRLVPATTKGSCTLYMGLRLPLRDSAELGPVYQPLEGLDELERDRSYRSAFQDLRRRLSWPRQVKAYLFDLASAYYPFLPDYDITYAFLVPFFLFGLWTARHRRVFWPAAGVVLSLSAAFTFFGGPVSRYRFGFIPLLILFAGLGAQALHERIRPKLLRACAAGWGILNIAVWLLAPSWRGLVLHLRDVIWR